MVGFLTLRPLLKAGAPSGVYCIELPQKLTFEFLFNQENVRFRTTYNALIDSVRIEESLENRIFFEYNATVMGNQKKQRLINQLRSLYSVGSPFLNTLNVEQDRLRSQQRAFVADLKRKHPQALATKLIESQQKVVIDTALTGETRRAALRARYFERIDFTCTALINSDVLVRSVWGYFPLFERKDARWETQVETYIQACDALLDRKDMAEQVRDVLVLATIGYFDYGDYDYVVAYLNERYVLPNLCTDATKADEVKKRIEDYRRLAIGNTAPDVLLDASAQQGQRLSSIRSEYLLVVFYTSWCSHCRETLPKLRDLYQRLDHGRFEVLAVSLDKDKQALLNFLVEGRYPWINYYDLKGEQSQPALDFGVKATPMMFLLDRHRKILAKPGSFEQVESRLTKLNIIPAERKN